MFFTDRSYYRLLPPKPADPGRARITLKLSDSGKFRTPSLRNVQNTWPYFHDGRLKTLEDVVEFYAVGGFPMPDSLPADPRIRPMPWTEQNKADVVAFLKAL